LTRFRIVDQYFGFPGEGYNFSFSDIEFHTVSNAPTLYRVYYYYFYYSIRVYLRSDLTAQRPVTKLARELRHTHYTIKIHIINVSIIGGEK
jgi:hypothetical protein